MAFKVALLGTGLMGYPMAEKLKDAGYHLTVYNRSIKKAKPLEAQGVSVVTSPNEAIKDSDLILFMLTDAAAIRNVLFSQTLDFLYWFNGS